MTYPTCPFPREVPPYRIYMTANFSYYFVYPKSLKNKKLLLLSVILCKCKVKFFMHK